MTAVAPGAAKRTKVDAGPNPVSGQTTVMKPEHVVAYDGKRMYTQETMAPAPASGALNQTNVFSFVVENDATGLLDDCVLRFQIEAEGGPMKVLPIGQWFERIEWYDRHTGREIARYYGDFMHWVLQTLPPTAKKLLSHPAALCPDSGKEGDFIQPAGTVQNYYLPLPHSWLDGFELDMSVLRGDLEIKFYPKGSILSTQETVEPVNGGGALNGVPRLREIRWIGESEMMSAVSRLALQRERATKTLQHNFVDVQRYTQAGVSIQANQEFTIDLDQFHHESGCLLITFRAQDSGSEALDYVSLGPKCTIDHENVHGRSMLGDGTAIDGEYARKFVASQFFSDDYAGKNAVYVIPFSRSLGTVLEGVVDGYHEFRGERERIRFVTDSVGVNAEVRADVGIGSTISSGNIVVKYKGCSTPKLDVATATVAELIAYLNNLTSVKKDNLRYRLSPTSITAGTAVTDTLDDAFNNGVARAVVFEVTDSGSNPRPLNNCGVFEIESTAQDATNIGSQFTVSLETQGRYGFGTAAAAPQSASTTGVYNVDIYSVYYRQVQMVNGRLVAQDL